jgi:hypothetical protein
MFFFGATKKIGTHGGPRTLGGGGGHGSTQTHKLKLFDYEVNSV